MRHRYLIALVAFAVLPSLGPAAEPDPAAQDEQVLKSAKLGTDGQALLEFFRKRVGTEATRARARDLVKQLGDDSFDQREKASAELTALGRVALPALRDAVKDRDPEVSRRAAECLRLLEDDAGPVLAAAAVRLLAIRKPDGAAGVLLDYLPSADSDAVADEVRAVLPSLAVRDGKPDPVLVKALADGAALKRAAAAEALGRGGAKGEAPALRKLLADADAGVRLRAALGLLALKERAAVPALIDLLADLPRDRGWEAEEVLRALAGEAAPEASLDGTDAVRAKVRDVWLAWWKKAGDKVDLARFDPANASLGLTLMVAFDDMGATGRVFEVGRDGKTRWEIKGLMNPCDARVVPGNHVLIAENGSNRVTERTFKGEVVWQKEVNGVFQCQRLPNGHTFIVALGGNLLEVDRQGNTVSSINRGAGRAAYKYPDGTIGVATDTKYTRLDASGKELKSFDIRVQIGNGICGVEFLRDGRLVVVQGDKVAEYDATGKVVWTAPVAGAYPLSRTAAGTTLVASHSEKRIIELDRQGKQVWEYKTGTTPWLARRR